MLLPGYNSAWFLFVCFTLSINNTFLFLSRYDVLAWVLLLTAIKDKCLLKSRWRAGSGRSHVFASKRALSQLLNIRATFRLGRSRFRFLRVAVLTVLLLLLLQPTVSVVFAAGSLDRIATSDRRSCASLRFLPFRRLIGGRGGGRRRGGRGGVAGVASA